MGTDTGALDVEHHGPVDLARAQVEAQAHVCQRYLGSAFESVVVVLDAGLVVHAGTSSSQSFFFTRSSEVPRVGP
ncbi:hypothetical protein [Shinella oryzae]|uniref:Uncharacterized protein n=1 Tax=Shinella oryzae TaxID=2871820 RepID=A0ABY9JZG7_9HYPH|nr:hypothetical protein [Shinella oryzae]WLS01715.1 hypothetical protein Q9315_09670 [Shinella oryzae]